MDTVGRNAPRASAWAKVTGAAEFPSDVVRPGMAHAVLVRSTIARGQVVRFDASTALAVPGVLAVFGPQDGPWPAYPPRVRRAIAEDVRFAGEEIGAVVAETERAAREALALLRVEYEQAPACMTLHQAQRDGAPDLTGKGNLPLGIEVLQHGDLQQAEASADVIVEASYSTPAQHHNPLEPHGCVAEWTGDELTLWDGNQGGHLIREWLARALSIDVARVRVHSRHVGGGFGSKIHLKPHHVIAAELARRIGRPVRLFMGRREEFIASHQRAATQRRIRIGASRDGRLRFIDEQVMGQAGPCAFLASVSAGAANGLRLHRVDAVRAEIRRVATNTQAPIPFRGPTTAEDVFCLEQAVDELAQAMGMDPLVLRLRNLAEIDVFQQLPYAGKALEQCYAQGAEAFGWRHRAAGSERAGDLARGIGLGAAAYDATLYEPSRAEVGRLANGRFEVRIGITDIGCGADTVFAQIAAEELGVPLHLVDTHFGDTATTPRSIDASNHSRTSAVVGPSVRAAARALKQRLVQAPAGEVITCGADREQAPAGVFPCMFAAHFVEVEVNVRSGRVRVVRAVCAHDAGRILNPLLARGQVEGGFLQGMGMALQEERLLDPRTGQMLNATMWAYRTPGVLEAPEHIHFVDAGVPDGANSLGVKGIGEPPLIASGAAIANAVHNAIGVRVRDYPITPAKVLRALGERGA
ncbi:xanthine dehydrogenase family protein molybdopterin-binding subunit [Caenimonas sedimenti]|uniref:xanthine dehydrogenase family protein molybdopterin-binding subunit n=1 Tax=Caenimonas sedimenti TaxID=2596921 RepID=UPI0016493CA6|nr:xanthine dehydrogenase family protein molybdopterin-binding subunit [Caenimonas sedimenti]